MFSETSYDPETKIFSGPSTEYIYNVNCSVGHIILTQLRKNPENIYEISDIDGRVVKGKELCAWSVRLAQHFKKWNLTHNDVIGICDNGSTYLSSLVYACLMNCSPLHPLSLMFDEEILCRLFSETQPKVVFCDAKSYQKIYNATKDWKPLIYTLTERIDNVPYIEDLLEPTITETFYKAVPLTSGADQTMAIMGSSGTTGFPKNACIANRTFLSYTQSLSTENVFCTFTGIYWITGLCLVVSTALDGNTRIYTNQPFSSDKFVDIVTKYKVTHSLLGTNDCATLCSSSQMTKENMKSIKMLMASGNYLSQSTMKKLQEQLTNGIFLNAYGSTETTGISLEMANSRSFLLANKRVRIVGKDGEPLGPNEKGEIQVYNKNWKGYYGKPDETKKIMTLDGWIQTGDWGYFDDNNFLHVVDRIKEVRKHGDIDYWPSDIEKIIFELPDVVDTCVIGIYDEKVGDIPAAVVIKAEGSSLTEQQIVDYVSKKIQMKDMHLRGGVIFTDQFPKNPNGKIYKQKVLEYFIKQKQNAN